MLWNKQEALEKFEVCKRRVNAKEQLLEDMKNECDLLKKQLFDSYKSQVVYMLLGDSTIKNVEKWLNMLRKNADSDGDKLDMRKKYPEKETYNIFIKDLQRYLGIEDMVITEVSHINFDNTYGIEFTSHDRKWLLQIPNIPYIKFDIFEYYGEYAFQLNLSVYEKDFVRCHIGGTFIEDELKDIMAQGIEKYCK